MPYELEVPPFKFMPVIHRHSLIGKPGLWGNSQNIYLATMQN